MCIRDRKATEYGFNFHTMYGEPYWSEEAYYKLTLAQVEKLEEVTAELHQMCLQAVEKVVASDELMAKFRICLLYTSKLYAGRGSGHHPPPVPVEVQFLVNMAAE